MQQEDRLFVNDEINTSDDVNGFINEYLDHMDSEIDASDALKKSFERQTEDVIIIMERYHAFETRHVNRCCVII